MNWFDAASRFKRQLLQVELAAFKARCESQEMMIQAERMQEDMNVKAERHLADSARWAQYERERLGIIEQHRNNAGSVAKEGDKMTVRVSKEKEAFLRERGVL